MRHCGHDNLYRECRGESGDGWVTIPTPGGHCRRSCQCEGGVRSDGSPIPVMETYCGMSHCGLDGQTYRCREGGWQVEGGACVGP